LTKSIKQAKTNAVTAKSNRSKLETAFVEAVLEDFYEHGREAIRKTREKAPDRYLKLVQELLPKAEAEQKNIQINFMRGLEERARDRAALAKPINTLQGKSGPGGAGDIPGNAGEVADNGAKSAG
jgi:hypothetical protein